mgnify:CR=1 FL=1
MIYRNRVFICLKLSKNYKIKLRRRAKNITLHFQRNLRRTLAITAGVVVGHTVKERALNIL